MQSTRVTKLIIDKTKIKNNIDSIQNYIGDNVEIMPIIKANAYGTHINYCLDILNKFKIVGVALVDEAVTIRKSGYKGNIFVLYPPVETEYQEIIKKKLIINGSNILSLQTLNNLCKDEVIDIHIEIETGMGRTGIKENEINDFIKSVKKLPHINIIGAFTHFASSNKDLKFTKLQIDRFNNALNIIKDNNIELKNIHVCNSGAIFTFKNSYYNMVRIGLLLYGYYPNERYKNEINLSPAVSLKTKINFLKCIDIDETVGYNKNFVAKRKSIIATIPFGFGDGLIGLETGIPYVIVNNKKAKIIGICMDNMMIDVTNIDNVNYDTEVIIWDNDKITIEQIASWIPDLCSYEILCTLSERIPREFVGD
ncbi:MAG: alanine racemase [Bacilli bacterium]